VDSAKPGRLRELGDETLELLERRDDGVVACHGLRRRRELHHQRPEPELREQRVAALTGRAAELEPLRLELDVDVGVDSHQLAALPRLVGVGLEPLAVLLLRHLVGARQQRVERSVTGDQIPRPLLADARNALDIVDGVAHQREHVDHLGRPDPELLLYSGGVVPRALVARVVDADAVADELEEILVAGDDRHPEPRRGRLHRQRADHIVSLESLGGEDRHPHRLAGLVHPGNLLPQIVGHRGAVGLVVGGELGAERRGRQVERRGDVLRPMIGQELPEHRDEAVDGVGRLAGRAGQPPDGVIRPVHLVAAVDQEQGARRH
jgi:hypothetical protein